MTTAAYAARTRYATDSVATASPARLLLMLFERLTRDLVAAEQAVEERDLGTASAQLLHAQAIIMELNTSLKPDVWDGARALSELYVFLHAELVAANLTKDAARIRGVRELVEPLHQTWREAAMAAATATATATA